MQTADCINSSQLHAKAQKNKISTPQIFVKRDELDTPVIEDG